METLLNNEMAQMDKAIHDAVAKIEQMISLASKKHSGIKLEVNEKILQACTSLMQAIKQLILDSKQLQKEIASKGRVCVDAYSRHLSHVSHLQGASSMKEFYQRNHRWTEGLISAAKTVAVDANLLVYDSLSMVMIGF